MPFNRMIASMMPLMPKAVVGFFSSRYIAGDCLEKALETAKRLNSENCMVTMDLLGEFVTTQDAVAKTVGTYNQILDAIKSEGIDGNVSIKPTSFGALIDESQCARDIETLVERARAQNNFVRIDMENHPYIDYTIRTYLDIDQRHHGYVGTVLQSYMKRTMDDVAHITANTEKANIRLCKGIYDEPEDVAFKDGARVNQNFLDALDYLFSKGAYVGIATHDDALLDGSLELIKKHQLRPDQYEFQMLLGVRWELRRKLVSDGHRLRVYTPFGEDWHPYSVRRLKENPAILSAAMRGFIMGGK